MKLKDEFVKNIKQYLGDEYDDFISSFSNPNEKGVHVNISKCQDNLCIEELIAATKIDDFENCYYTNEERIGSHPLSHSGLVYSQDPSAMMPVNAILPLLSKNMKVLDLCAAPGGKSSQLATYLTKLNGLLVSNEINKARNQILKSNMERMGYLNNIVTNKSAMELAIDYPSYFDLIVVDAPCSGEGMFRKYPESIDEWTSESNLNCSTMQREILDYAVRCLKPGGYLLYSTCTYSPLENEEIIRYICANYNFSVVNPPESIISSSVCIKDYDYYKQMEPLNGIEGCRRFYPHKYKGEGQFLCILKSNEKTLGADLKSTKPSKLFKLLNGPSLEIVKKSLKDSVDLSDYDLYTLSQLIVALPKGDYPYIPANKVTMAGVIVGEIVKNRLVPHHQLFHMLGHLFYNKIELSGQIDLLAKYLHGEEIYVESSPNGFGVISYYGASIGGFKSVNGRLKNYYPKGLRNNN